MIEEYVPIRIPSWRYDEIEKKVVDLYVELNINKVPVDPFKIIEAKGYLAKPFSDLVRDIIQPSSFDQENDAFSFFSPKDNSFIITYDDKKELIRLRFTLMHEIGHIVLGHKCESDLARKEADYFAAYALAPSPLIYYLLKGNTEAIKTKFLVSKQCAEICANRYINWDMYGSDKLKEYEEIIISLFK